MASASHMERMILMKHVRTFTSVQQRVVTHYQSQLPAQPPGRTLQTHFSLRWWQYTAQLPVTPDMPLPAHCHLQFNRSKAARNAIASSLSRTATSVRFLIFALKVQVFYTTGKEGYKRKARHRGSTAASTTNPLLATARTQQSSTSAACMTALWLRQASPLASGFETRNHICNL